MSSIPFANPQVSSDRVNQPTFLGITPETRNVIYNYAFSIDKVRGLGPHPFTRVNRQVRQESMLMECRSVETLVILLQTRRHIDHFEHWANMEIIRPNYILADRATGKVVPSYPDLEFRYTCAKARASKYPSRVRISVLPHCAHTRTCTLFLVITSSDT
jgi:hypothetical protein